MKVPVLVLFGADDELVPPEESIAETVRILKDHGNRAFAVRVFPGADHTLHVPAGEPGGWPHVVPGFFEAVTSFAQSAGAASSR